MATRWSVRRLPLLLHRVRSLHAGATSLSPNKTPTSAPVAADFGQWLQQTAQPETKRNVALAVREYLDVPDVDHAPLTAARRQQVISSSEFITKIGAVAHWSFQTHGDAIRSPNPPPAGHLHEIEGVWRELQPWGNAAKSSQWQHFYMRKFFLSHAPLQSFIACYDVHRSVLEANDERVASLPVALLTRELCWRGRFDEAVDAYTKLELSDTERRSFTAVLHEYEQYEALRRVYALQDQLDAQQHRDAALLDPLFILQALKALGLREELIDRFETLPQHDQRRAEIQDLLTEA